MYSIIYRLRANHGLEINTPEKVIYCPHDSLERIEIKGAKRLIKEFNFECQLKLYPEN